MFRFTFLLFLFYFLPCIFGMMKGISFYGLETEYRGFSCDWVKTINVMIDDVKQLGFNTIRVPFSLQYINENDFKKLDEFFVAVEKSNMDVMLDFHRLNSIKQSAKMYDNIYSFDDFLEGWKFILDRYKHYPNLKYVDIFNEWQDNNYIEMNELYTEAVIFLENHFPNRFVYFIQGHNWGGNLKNVKIDVPFQDRIIYTIHKYHFSNTEPYETEWQKDFELDKHKNICVGEFGWISTNKKEVEWGWRFLNWLKENDITNTVFWQYGFHSWDTQGIFGTFDNDGCSIVDTKKIEMLNKLWT